MTETVDVLVQVFDRGQTRKQIVPVEESCFEPGKSCWKTVACVKAAVLLELPFAWLLERAKYGMKPEDLERLRGLYRKTDCRGPQEALAMTETKEEAST